MPLLVDLQPAGEYLGEDYHRAGDVPALVKELMGRGLIQKGALTATGARSARTARTRRHDRG